MIEKWNGCMKPNEDMAAEHHSEDPPYNMLPKVKLGQTVYLVAYPGDIVIPSRVVEIDEWYTINGQSVHATFWEDGSSEVIVSDGNWYRSESVEYLKGHRPCSRFFDVDEPIGHSVQFDTHDVYPTLEDALKMVYPSKKKHLKRRLKAYRKSVQGFIASTWGENQHPGFEKLPLKKVYVKRK